MRQLLVLSFILAGCLESPSPLATSTRSDPLLAGQPLLVSDPPIPGPYLSGDDFTRVAVGSTTSLAVWPTFTGTPFQSRIRASRIGATGPVEASGFAVGPLGEDSQGSPDVAFNGTNFFVVWRSATGISLARVTQAGTVLDPIPRVLSALGLSPAIACGSTDCLVTWVEAGDVRGAFVGPSGAVINNPAPFSLEAGSSPRVASTNGAYLLVWTNPAIRAATATQGAIGTPFTLNASGAFPSVGGAVGSNGFLVAWGNAGDIVGKRVDTLGGVLDTMPRTISAATGSQFVPAVTWLETPTTANWVVAWSDARSSPTSIVGTRMTTTGTVLDPGGVFLAIASTELVFPSFSASGGQLTWRRQVAAGQRTFATARVSVSPTGLSVGAAAAVATRSNAQVGPSMAWNGTRTLAVWVDDFGQGGIVGSRVLPDGGPDQSLLIFAESDGGFSLSTPHALRFGTGYEVFWHQGNTVRSSSVSTTGAPSTSSLALSSSTVVESSLAGATHSNGFYMLTWEDFGSNFGVHVGSGGSGTFVGPGRVPRIAAATTGYILVWSATGGLRASRIGSNGGVLDPGGIALTTTGPNDFPSSVDVLGTTVLVTYSETGTGRVRALMMTDTLSSVRFVDVALDAGTPRSITNDGARFLVTTAQPTGVFARRFDVAGNPIEPVAQLIEASAPTGSSTPGTAALCIAPRRCQVLSSVFDATAGVFTWRVSLRNVLLTDAPTASSQSVTVPEDGTVAITLSGTDPDSDPLSFTITTAPMRGVLMGSPPVVTYVPAANYVGTDSFAFVANDGTVSSAPAVVNLQVTAVNDAPVANSQVIDVGGAPVAFRLTGSDVDGDPLTFSILSGPDAGTLSGTSPNLVWTPRTFSSSDVIAFRASDGLLSSAPATVTFRFDGGSGGGSAGGGSAGGGSAAGGSAAGGSAAGGSAAGGSAAGGSAAGGSAAGGSAAGGSAAGGSAAGGSAAGGSAAGGSAAGGSAA
ncbi:MAG: cadherin-like domain-containing protein, partial [Myxococcales bacterium]|nr:cadherin-like domain-containing protein [Myxococcales bacterium]